MVPIVLQTLCAKSHIPTLFRHLFRCNSNWVSFLTRCLILLQPSPSTRKQHTARCKCATQISFTDNQISQINTNAQPSEESTGVAPTNFSESLSSPVMMSAPHSEVILSPVESAPVRPHRVSPAFGPPRSILTTGGLPSPPTDHGQPE
jgi:hypothetical protein